MKKILISLATIVLSIVTMVIVSSNSNLDYIANNVDALANPEDFQTSYLREEGTCSIFVEAHSKVKLFNGTILEADANGEIRFDGKVVCIAGGTKSCTPIECATLYQVIL